MVTESLGADSDSRQGDASTTGDGVSTAAGLGKVYKAIFVWFTVVCNAYGASVVTESFMTDSN